MKKAIILIVFIFYASLWVDQKNRIVWTDYYLSPPMPTPVTKIISGFGKKMSGFSLFIKTAIFTGGPLKQVKEADYVDSLTQNFDVMTQLYPDFIDPYYFCQAFVPHISMDSARQTNDILLRAIKEYPDSLYFPFFRGFNYFKYLNEPVEAAKVFQAAAELPDAPPLFQSLGGKLLGQGGHLTSGRDMLAVMYKSEENEIVKERYKKEIENFNSAIQVQDALNLFKSLNGREAKSLEELIPNFLDSLPNLHYGYILSWQPPLLKLVQPVQ